MVGSGLESFPHIYTDRDCGYVVRPAIQSPRGKNIFAAGRIMSWTEHLQIWCEVNNVPFGGFDEIPLEKYEKFIPVPDLGRKIGEIMLFINEFGYCGGDPSVVLLRDVGYTAPAILILLITILSAWSSLPFDHLRSIG